MKICVAICLLGAVGSANCAKAKKVSKSSDVGQLGNGFRCDYTFYPGLEAYLKLHTIPADFYEARLRCHLEGAVLASPLTEHLYDELMTLAKQTVNHNIHLGVSSTISRGDHRSVEGVALKDLFIKWAPNNPDNMDNIESCMILDFTGVGDRSCDLTHPYVCYKPANTSMVVSACGTVDNDYHLFSDTNHCYKIHTVPRDFSRAFMACEAEGGHLAIINSLRESQFLAQLYNQYPDGDVVGTFEKSFAFVGFLDYGQHGEWLTIHGQTLYDAGFNHFQPGEPNNRSGIEFCGSIYRTGLLNDLQCDDVHMFFCEKDPKSLQNC